MGKIRNESMKMKTETLVAWWVASVLFALGIGVIATTVYWTGFLRDHYESDAIDRGYAEYYLGDEDNFRWLPPSEPRTVKETSVVRWSDAPFLKEEQPDEFEAGYIVDVIYSDGTEDSFLTVNNFAVEKFKYNFPNDRSLSRMQFDERGLKK